MTRRDEAPLLLFIIGPPAVGKMTVGHEIARLTGLKLFHNHLSIEPALRVFDYGDRGFVRVVEEFRRGVLEEVAAGDSVGVIFTFVWAFDQPADAETVDRYSAAFRERGGRVLFVELRASLEERLRRNETEFRLSEKASKRDVASSRHKLLEHESEHRFSSENEHDDRPDWLVIDNTDLEPEVVAESVIDRFAIARLQ
jgi:hypothetical protein